MRFARKLSHGGRSPRSQRAEDRRPTSGSCIEAGALREHYRHRMCSHVLRTQEELPAKPGSGSEGSSIVESMSIASMHSSTGLLCTSLMPVMDNVLGRALKAGRHAATPTTMTVHGLCIDLGMSCYAAQTAR